MSQTRPQGCERHKSASETAVLLPGPAAPPPSNGGDRDITTLFQLATDTRMEPLDTKNKQYKHFQGSEGDIHGSVAWGITRKIQKNAYYIYMERNFVHFFIVKKKLNFRPIILENMDILEKERLSEIWDSKFYCS
jgi:hypothetical protein